MAEPRTDGVFSARTDTVLIFVGGRQGLLAIDLDHSRVAQHDIDGYFFGSPGIASIGDRAILATSDDGTVTTLPTDTLPGSLPSEGGLFFALRAHGMDALWVTEPQTGAESDPYSTFHLVALDGTLLDTVEVSTPELDWRLATPAAASGHTLLFGSRSGLRIWNTVTNAVTILGSGRANVWDVSASGRVVSWCEEPCTDLHMTDLRTTSGRIDDRVVRQSSKHPFGSGGSFSPHGRFLAITKRDTAGYTVDTRVDLVLIDSARGAETLIARDLRNGAQTEWSPDGRMLFFAEQHFGTGPTTIGMFDLDTRTTTRATVPFSELGRLLTLDRDQAIAFLASISPVESDCSTISTNACSGPLRVQRHRPTSSKSETCLVTTRTDEDPVDSGLYSGDAFDTTGEGELSAYIPNNGERIAGTRPDGRHDFKFFWVGPTGSEEVEVTGRLLDGPKDATFELEPDRRSATVSDPGCWRFTGRVGDEQLTVTMAIYAADPTG